MKRIILGVILFLTASKYVNAQESALEKLGKETCEYFSANTEEISKLSSEEKTAKLGLQMLALYGKYEKELNKEGIKVDFGNQKSAEKLGEQIGLKMAKYCPEILVTLFGEMTEEEEGDEFSIKGVLKKVEGDELSILVIKDNNSKTQKFVWLDNFEGSDDLIENLGDLENKKVEVFYKNLEFFSPKLKEYIVRKKISKLNFVE